MEEFLKWLNRCSMMQWSSRLVHSPPPPPLYCAPLKTLWGAAETYEHKTGTQERGATWKIFCKERETRRKKSRNEGTGNAKAHRNAHPSLNFIGVTLYIMCRRHGNSMQGSAKSHLAVVRMLQQSLTTSMQSRAWLNAESSNWMQNLSSRCRV